MLRSFALMMLLSFAFACATNRAERAPAEALAPNELETPIKLAPGESVITLIGTNDIHGGLEESVNEEGKFGGFPWFAGYVAAVREHSKRNYGANGVVLLLDAGDAIQGTLLSDFSEGQLATRLMRRVRYDAAIIGNHGFDFGPVGWKVDQCGPSKSLCDPLGALREVIKTAASASNPAEERPFPFLAANIQTKDGKKADFVDSYGIIRFQGRGVAVIGLENAQTKTTTVPDNVKNLEFSDGMKELEKTVKTLWDNNLADVFVLVMHEGGMGMAQFLKSLPKRADGQPLVDAVIAGHTHGLDNAMSDKITPYVQSESDGHKFGLVQLVVRNEKGRLRVDRGKTRKKAGFPILADERTFMGEAVRPDAGIAREIAEARAEIASTANEPVAVATGHFDREEGRISDSIMGNFVADQMRKATGGGIALINSGDVRDDFPAPENGRSVQLTFEHVFKVIPKNSKLVTVQIPLKNLERNLTQAVKSCRIRGVLQVSGIRVFFNRDCSGGKDEDYKAELLKIVSDSGKVIWDRREKDSPAVAQATVNVTTTEFVTSGGAGYNIKGAPPVERGQLRDAVLNGMKNLKTLNPADFPRGRYVNCKDEKFKADALCK